MFTKNQQGQTLILMLIVTVVSLTVGVAISSRAISTLKQTSYTAQAGKAQKFADAGVEEALGAADLSVLAATCPDVDHPCTIDFDGGDDDVEYYIEQSGGGTIVETPIEKDTTIQIDLAGYTGSNIKIYWVSGTTEEDNKAALIFSLIYEDGGETKIEKHAYDPDADRRQGANGNNFTAPGLGADINGKTYNYSTELLSIPPVIKALRIRALYNDTPNSIVVQSPGGQSFSNQGYKITSTGTYGEAEWTAEVTKMNPALPAIFDFAIFSDTSLTK